MSSTTTIAGWVTMWGDDVPSPSRLPVRNLEEELSTTSLTVQRAADAEREREVLGRRRDDERARNRRKKSETRAELTAAKRAQVQAGNHE